MKKRNLKRGEVFTQTISHPITGELRWLEYPKAFDPRGFDLRGGVPDNTTIYGPFITEAEVKESLIERGDDTAKISDDEIMAIETGPLADSEIEMDRLPWCIVVPIKNKDTGQEYSDPDIVGPFATCAEAQLWLDYYDQLGDMYGRGELRCMISPALERAVRREAEEFYQKKFGASASLKKPPEASEEA